MNSREKFASELVGRIFAGTSDWSYILYEPAKILTRVSRLALFRKVESPSKEKPHLFNW